MKERASGILLHPTSLPGKYGIGTLGNEAINFIDFLVEAKQKFWQILPLGPTGFADSPYQCFSSGAGNPLLIDLETLVTENLLTKNDLDELSPFDNGPVNYGKVIETKIPLLKKAATIFFQQSGSKDWDTYQKFLIASNGWLPDYCLYMSLKEHFGQRSWQKWPVPVKMMEEAAVAPLKEKLQESIRFHQIVQYLFFRQWITVKNYAHESGIRIIGDIPLYIALDSADAWAHAEIFLFDEKKVPVAVGGVPPDYFSETGQLWGNPLFRWDLLKETGYKWWIDRIKASLILYDIIRIDHFRGFAGYWSVPYGEKTAINGRWIPGPGKDIFEVIRKELGDVPIIAEDLGVITDDVTELRDSFDLPGMKILQFAFDSAEANDYLPHNYSRNCIVYTGTHDNDTVMGWFQKAKKEDKQYLLDYINTDEKNVCWGLIRLAWSSVALTAIVPMQDLLGLGSEARMNLPGTTINNWMWRMKHGQLSQELAEKLAHITKLYDRVTK